MAKNTKKSGQKKTANQKLVSEQARNKADQMYAQRQAAKKKAKTTGDKKDKKKRGGYWKGVRSEMSKVLWPTRKELGTYTAIVIITCAVCAVAFWAIDTGVLAAFKGIM